MSVSCKERSQSLQDFKDLSGLSLRFLSSFGRQRLRNPLIFIRFSPFLFPPPPLRDEWGGRGGHALGGGRDDRRSMATDRGGAVEVRGAGVREREREDGVRGGRGGYGIAGSDSSLLFREANLAPAIVGSNSRRDQPPAVGRERVAPAVREGEGAGAGMRYLEDDDDGDM